MEGSPPRSCRLGVEEEGCPAGAVEVRTKRRAVGPGVEVVEEGRPLFQSLGRLWTPLAQEQADLLPEVELHQLSEDLWAFPSLLLQEDSPRSP